MCLNNGCISQYVIVLEGCISLIQKLLHWRDASPSTGAPEAYLTRSGLTRAKRRCRGRGLSRDLCMRTASEPEVLSSSNNCMYLVPRGLERPCDLLIPKCSLWEIKLDWLMWHFGKAVH